MPNEPCPVCERPAGECPWPSRCRYVIALSDRLAALEGWARVFSGFDEPARRFPAPATSEPTPPPSVVAMERDDPRLLYPIAEYHEDDGAVLWWHVPIQEPPHAGSPLETDFDREFYTHFSFFVTPSEPGRSAPVASGTPPPGNPGIPEGWKLAEGWRALSADDARRLCWSDLKCDEPGIVAGIGLLNARCFRHAVEMGALTRVEPPAKAEPDCPQCDGGVCVGLSPVKAEATQAAEPPKCHVCHEDDATCLYPTSDGRHWCKCCRCKRCGNSPPNGSTCLCDYRPVEQAAEPSAPAGYSREYIVACSEEAFGAPTVRGKPAAPPVAACLYPDKCGKRWLRKGVLYDGDDGSPPWQCPNCKAPPVTAKLSERTDAAQQAIYHAAMARVAELETALNAAKRSLQQSREAYSIVDAERNAAKAEAKKCGDEWDLLCGAMCTECADHVVTKGQLATRDARIAGLEASAAEDSKARAALEARCAAAEHDAGVLRDRFVGMSGWGRQ